MKSRALRFALLTLFVGSIAGAAYVVWSEESRARTAAASTRTIDNRIEHISRALLDLKGAQPGYVAAGQGDDYWASRVDALRGRVRDGLAALRPRVATPVAQGEIDAAAAAFHDFEQMDRRAREYAVNGQRLLASDLVFSDGIEKIDGAVAALDRAREAERAADDAAAGARRRSQLVALGGAAAAGLMILLALTPLPHPEVEAPAAKVVPESADLPLIAPRRPAAAPVPAPSPPAPEPAPVVAAAPPPPVKPPKPAPPAVDLQGIASLCTELARVLDTRALPGALERAAALLDASGIIIWVSDPDGRELTPVLAHGYAQHLVSRLGTIPRDAENATAAAYRTGVVQTVRSEENSPGAIAAPLLSPTGPVGVMAAEVRHDGERKDAIRAATAIVAAQLATLMGPPASRTQGKAEVAGA